MRDILDASPVAVAVISPATTQRLYVNKSLVRLFGASSEEALLNHSVEDSWADPERYRQLQDILNAGQDLQDFEAERVKKDGSSCWTLMNSYPIEFEGKPARIVWHEDITEHKRAQDVLARAEEGFDGLFRQKTVELEKSKNRLWQLSELTSDWLWEMDADLRFTYFSNRAMDVPGVPAANFIGKTREEVTQENTNTEKWQAHFQTLRDHKPFRDFRYTRPVEGEGPRIFSTSGMPLFDEAGTFQGYFGISSDVTEQVSAAERIKRADERLFEAIYAFSEPFALWGPDDRLVIGNQVFQKLNEPLGDKARPGVLYEEFARALVEQGQIPEAEGREEEWLKARVEAHRNPKGGFEQLRKDGVWFLIQEQEFHDGSRATISSDITRLKQTEAKLKESQERFQDFAEVAAEWYWEQGADLKFTDMSEDNLAITGLTAASHMGKYRWEVGLLDVSEAEWENHKKLLEARQPFFDFRASRQQPGGKKLYISLSGKPIFDSEGRFAGYRGTGKNITDIVEAQMALVAERDRAEKANQAKTEFLANMSHELRTPLNSIIGYSQMIKDQILGPLDNPKYMEYAQDINASGEHLLMVISDILDISKIETGDLEVEAAETDIRKTTEAAILITELMVRSKGHQLNIHMPDNLPHLNVDDRLIRQVLINLLTNAVKFTPPQGRIDVSAAVAEDGGVTVTVSDTGVGIAPENLERALEPFGQIRDAPAIAHEGTGLGLSLSKRLMELHGGRLSIESEEGQGASVTLHFPKERILPTTD